MNRNLFYVPAALLVAGLTLPWASATAPFVGTIDISGWSVGRDIGLAWVILVSGALITAAAVTGRTKFAGAGSLVATAAAALGLFHTVTTVSGGDSSEYVVAQLGPGGLVTLAAAVTGAVMSYRTSRATGTVGEPAATMAPANQVTAAS